MTSGVEAQVRVITGPTASGKSTHALEIAAEDSNIEIVNADAFQLYRDISIGTAQPAPEVLTAVPHHLYGILSLNESLSAGRYAALARSRIREIIDRGKTPLVVGGSLFYLEALFYGLANTSIDSEVLSKARARAKQDLEANGEDNMLERLRPIDPALAEQFDRERNPIRLIRAWEYYYATGMSLGEARRASRDAFEIRPCFEILTLPAVELRGRIAVRLTKIAEAWLTEVKELIARGETPEQPGFRAIGYKEFFAVVHGGLTMKDAISAIEVQTAQYAKKQRTLLRRIANAHPLDIRTSIAGP